MKYLFVINPISGGQDKTQIINQIKSSFLNPLFFYTSGSNDLSLLQLTLYADKPDILVAVGGDGTILLCAEAILKTTHKPKIGIIPAGSANGLSTELNITNNIEEAIDRIKNSTYTKNVDIIQVNNDHYCMHIGDAGLNARIVRDYEQDNERGFLTYAKYFVEELAQSKPFKIEIKINDKEYHEEGYMLAIANAQKYGTGVKLNYQSKVDDGIFEICILKNINVSTFLKAGLTALDINLNENDSIKIISCKNAEIKFNQKVPFQLDGEYFGEVSEFKTKLITSAIAVIVS